MKWFCAQIGAREHYAVPRALHRSGRLGALFTDFWTGAPLRGVVSRIGRGRWRAIGQRWHRELATAAVRDCGIRAIGWESELRKRARAGRLYEGYLKVGEAFGRRVAERLTKEVAAGDVVFAYDTGALEILTLSRSAGALAVVDQMDPGRVEERLVREERERWPGWEMKEERIPEAYHARREQEWARADRVVVNSEFCRKALLEQGVAAEKLAVVPLGVELEAGSWERGAGSGGQGAGSVRLRQGHEATKKDGELRVLFLGQVILRKGIQYLIEAAKLLTGENVEFHVVGPIGIAVEAVRSAPANLHFHGPVTRDDTAGWYARSDVFVLPTISDGFAITQLEAMARGLPVIATPHCGEVVQPERNGLIVPIRDERALASGILRFAGDAAWREACSRNARERVKDFSIEALADRLGKLEHEPTAQRRTGQRRTSGGE